MNDVQEGSGEAVEAVGALVRTDDKRQLFRAELIDKLLDRLPWIALPASVIQAMTRSAKHATKSYLGTVLFTVGLGPGVLISWALILGLGIESVIVTAILGLSFTMSTALSFPLLSRKVRKVISLLAQFEQARREYQETREGIDKYARSLLKNGMKEEEVIKKIRARHRRALERYLKVVEQPGVDFRPLLAIGAASNESDDDPPKP